MISKYTCTTILMLYHHNYLIWYFMNFVNYKHGNRHVYYNHGCYYRFEQNNTMCKSFLSVTEVLLLFSLPCTTPTLSSNHDKNPFLDSHIFYSLYPDKHILNSGKAFATRFSQNKVCIILARRSPLCRYDGEIFPYNSMQKYHHQRGKAASGKLV